MFGQVVIGPPGSGKTTYCDGMQQLTASLGRKPAVINLDPANENLPFECAIDIKDLINVEDVMEYHKLGPNGAMVYCMNFLRANLTWLKEHLEPLKKEGRYIIIDCPGQVELYTHDTSVRDILIHLQKWGYRLTCLHLVDAHYCSSPPKFLSALLVSLSSVVLLEMPHINVLSKIDLLGVYGKPQFGLEFYTEVGDLHYLLDCFRDETAGQQRYKRLNEAVIELVEDFGMVSFRTLNISDKKSVAGVLKEVDKCNGYVFGHLENSSTDLFNVTYTDHQEDLLSVEEKYMNVDTSSDSDDDHNDNNHTN